MEADFTEVCDRLQDQTREIGRLAKAVLARETPVVNVEARAASPDVTIQAPVNNITISKEPVSLEVT